MSRVLTADTSTNNRVNKLSYSELGNAAEYFETSRTFFYLLLATAASSARRFGGRDTDTAVRSKLKYYSDCPPL